MSVVARETLLDPDEHIRLDIFNEEIAGVLPDLHQEFLQEGDDLLRVHFAISSRLMITARRKPLRAIELTRRAIDSGRKFPTPVSLFDAIVDQFADVIGRYSAGLGDELDIVENHVKELLPIAFPGGVLPAATYKQIQGRLVPLCEERGWKVPSIRSIGRARRRGQ